MTGNVINFTSNAMGMAKVFSTSLFLNTIESLLTQLVLIIPTDPSVVECQERRLQCSDVLFHCVQAKR
ncbi:hypothetical protein SV7mr_18900 [Stieleria bergensis]|uniref:Uncharacterized protein n=1 Tax=Stieleria bergensis TaxID=2528025 RepID=A0A517STH5_9BACT|nr:hypothetical protein SV7mr_18900 [Planctomycetes bacterium SV_7m_r]